MSLTKTLFVIPFLLSPVIAQQAQRPNVVQQQLNRTFRTDIARNEQDRNELREEIHEVAAEIAVLRIAIGVLREEIYGIAAENAKLKIGQESISSNAFSERAMWLLILTLCGERGIFHYRRMK